MIAPRTNSGCDAQDCSSGTLKRCESTGRASAAAKVLVSQAQGEFDPLEEPMLEKFGVVFACSPIAGEAKTGRSPGLAGQPTLPPWGIPGQ